MKLTADELTKIDKFMEQFDGHTKELLDNFHLLNLQDKDKELADNAINILAKARKKMNKAKSMEDLKKVIKVKKIIKGK